MDFHTEYANKEVIHFYFVAGEKFDLNESMQLKTHFMLKAIKNAPLSFDLTALADFQENSGWA